MNARNGTTMTRRWFMRLAGAPALGAAAVLLAACGSEPTAAPRAPGAAGAPSPAAAGAQAPTAAGAQAPAAAKVPARKDMTLNLIWDGWIIDQNPVVNDLASRYTEETGVKIAADKSPPDLDQKILLEARQGKSTWGGREGHSNTSTAPLVEGGALAPWDAFLTKEDLDDLYETSKEEMRYQGKYYHFPFRVSPVLIGVWPRTLEKLGFKDLPTTWDQTTQIAEKAAKELSTPSERFFGYGFLADPAYGLWAVMATLTRKPFDPATGLADLDQPAAVEALQIMQKLYPVSPPEGLGDLTALTNTMLTGRMAMVQVHVVRAGRAKDKFKDDFRIGRLPHGKDAEGTNYWSSGPNLLKNYGDATVQGEVARFWLWLSKRRELFDTMWLKNGSPPNRKSLQKQYEPLKGKEIDPGYWELFQQQEVSQPKPASLVIGIQEKYALREVANLMLGKTKTPEEAIGLIKKQTADEVAKQQR
jgi:ABC-type glycerol-3-phosphate transport system substrate-binding protein